MHYLGRENRGEEVDTGSIVCLSDKQKKLVAGFRIAHAILIVILIMFYFIIASRLGVGSMDGGPDEFMRALVPKAIANGNLFPSGYDSDVIYGLGNWSYAFYPQVLGAYVSAFFMILAKLFGFAESQVFIAGRMASILFGIITVQMVSMTVAVLLRRIVTEDIVRVFQLVTGLLMGFWPQFAFLSSYMNNDIVALCGVSIIIFSLSSGIIDGWNITKSVQFSFGVTVVALGYWNACTFALVGIPLFIVSVAAQKSPIQEKVKCVAVAVALAAVCVLPFYIANLIRYGDLLGMSVFHERYLEWLADGGEVLQHPWTEGVRALFIDSGFVGDTFRSFVGTLGYMSIPIPNVFFYFYLILIVLGVGGFLTRVEIFFCKKMEKCLGLCILLACALTIGLFIYYTINVDYQPQGRYIIYLLIPIVIAAALGFFLQCEASESISHGEKTVSISYRSMLMLVLVLIAYSASTVWFFHYAISMYGWSGL